MILSVFYGNIKGKTEEGNTKWQSNVELHRGYISTHRVDASYSERYAALEDVFVHIADGKNNGTSESIYKLDPLEKNALENFLQARNQGMLFSKGNVNPETGTPTIVDPEICIGVVKIYLIAGKS